MTLNKALTLYHVLTELSKLNPQNKVYFTTHTKAASLNSKYNFTGNGIPLLTSQDPFDIIVSNLKHSTNELTITTTTITTDQLTILKSLPHLYNLRDSSTVINIDLNRTDYSIIPALKDLDFPSFISNDLSSLINNGILIYQLAISNKQPVFHFINFHYIENNQIHNNNDFILPKFI